MDYLVLLILTVRISPGFQVGVFLHSTWRWNLEYLHVAHILYHWAPTFPTNGFTLAETRAVLPAWEFPRTLAAVYTVCKSLLLDTCVLWLTSIPWLYISSDVLKWRLEVSTDDRKNPYLEWALCPVTKIGILGKNRLKGEMYVLLGLFLNGKQWLPLHIYFQRHASEKDHSSGHIVRTIKVHFSEYGFWSSATISEKS